MRGVTQVTPFRLDMMNIISNLVLANNYNRCDWLELFKQLEATKKISFSEDDKESLKELTLKRRPLNNELLTDEYIMSHRDFGAYLEDMDHKLDTVRELFIVQTRENRLRYIFIEH